MPSSLHTNHFITGSSSELKDRFNSWVDECLEFYFSGEKNNYSADYKNILDKRRLEWIEFFSHDLYDIVERIHQANELEVPWLEIEQLQTVQAEAILKTESHRKLREKWKETKYKDLFDSLDSFTEGDQDLVEKYLLELAKLRNDFYQQYGHAPEEDDPDKKL